MARPPHPLVPSALLPLLLLLALLAPPARSRQQHLPSVGSGAFLAPPPPARGHHPAPSIPTRRRPSPAAPAGASDSDSDSNGPSPPSTFNADALSHDIYDRTRPPPLVVTIGPQCGGKTSLLRRLNATRPAGAPPLVDVAIDDDRDVYRRVPMRAFLEGALAGPRDPLIRGRRASARCTDPGPEECRLVLGYLAGLWPLQEAERRLAAIPSTVRVCLCWVGGGELGG
jgi:hypothetical protein